MAKFFIPKTKEKTLIGFLDPMPVMPHRVDNLTAGHCWIGRRSGTPATFATRTSAPFTINSTDARMATLR
jgi:hypothetical protein